MAIRDLVRPALASLALVLSTPAWAGDSAQFDAIGYSEDGRYFAFEQFGIQDGSGFPYSEIFVIDLETDSFAAGAPFEARIDREMASLPDARAEAMEMADAALADLEITRPALPMVLRGDGALEDEGLSIRYGIPSYGLAQTEGEIELSLETFKAGTAQDCELFEGDPMGFALFAEAYGDSVELHRDTRVPTSRHCVITYKIYGVFQPFNSFDNASSVAVLSVWSHGFEGPDRRFIALPVGDR